MTLRLWLSSQLIFSCFGLIYGEYMGCYRDPEGTLMKAYSQNFVLTLTPDRCISLCTRKGFQYAGVKSRITCFCDILPPASSLLSEDSNACQSMCVGDSSKICGGEMAISIYYTSLAEENDEVKVTTTENFTICSKDDDNHQLLTNYQKEITKNAPEKCKNLCYSLGFLYSGVKHRTQCFCGDNHPPATLLKNESQCHGTCPAGLNWCEADKLVHVYSTGITDIPVNGKKLGCFDDEDPRVLKDYKKDLEKTNSPRRCMNLCRSLGYNFSGVEYGIECFCGNTIDINTERDVPDEQCETACPGDKFDTCGGNWKIQVYRTGLTDPETVINKVACIPSDDSLLLEGFRQNFPQSTSSDKCAIVCYNKGFSYSASVFRTQCWCGKEKPKSVLTKTNLCNEKTWIYDTGLRVPYLSEKDHYLGCFKDDKQEISLDGYKHEFETQLSPKICSIMCFNKGYLFAGIKKKIECHCGDNPHLNDLIKVMDEECSSHCDGDDSKYCGGHERMSLYSTGISDVPEQGKRIGCFKDEVWPRALGEHKTDFTKTNSPRRCSNYCLTLGFLYAGVEYQMECFCGNSRPNSTLYVPDNQCNAACSGDSSEICGGGWRMEIYRTGFSHTTPTPTVPPVSHKTDSSCELSETLVNGRHVCRGAVVFEDNFNGSSIASHWHHTVKIADSPDYEFVSYSLDPGNSFQENGKLIIKPTLLSDREVVEGTLKLDGCTGLAGSRECELTAISYNILPPVKSARLNTHKSFNFRYGTVEITAKFPSGDWIVPELWLLPKEQSYGTNYLSGKIKVAMSRGNRYLSHMGKDIGSSILESGIMIGPDDNVKTRSVANRISDSWNTRSHKYTLVWTPDNLLFYVDGQSQQALLPPGVKLADLLGFNNSATSPWNVGSRIAPFDTDFYLSLGVSVGGARDFPDGCMSRNKIKPWTNFKLKAMLNFWLDKESWHTSWDETTSRMIVEHVQVTAL